jgi:hypothetical protein
MRLFYFIAIFLLACNQDLSEVSKNTPAFSTEIDVDDEFYFEKGIYQVTNNVYVAIGYGLANSILITGDSGNIIIDTTEDPQLASEINKEFKKYLIYPTKQLFIRTPM